MHGTTTLTLRSTDLPPLRLILREQLAGDTELRRDLLAGRGDDGDPPEYRLSAVVDRLAFVERVVEQVGLY